MPIPTPEPLLDVERARELMDAAGLDAIVAHSPRNLFYLSSYLFGDVQVEPEACAFAVLPARADVPAQVTISSWARYTVEDFPVWPPGKIFVGSFYIKDGPPVDGEAAADSVDALSRALRAVGAENGRVGFELSLLPVVVHHRVVAALPGLEILDAGPVLQELRARKTPTELERIRTATHAIEAAIGEALDQIRVGVTEREVDCRVREALVRRGVDPVTVFVGAGGRGALVWSIALDRPLVPGDVIRFDITASYGGYCSDLSREGVVGEPTPEQQAYYRAVRLALDAGIGAVRPGGLAAEVFEATVETVRQNGFPDYQRPNVGHGLGLQVHEPPILGPQGGEIPFPAALAVEVPYYVYGFGAFSPEDVVVVTDAGVERLTVAPAELPVVG
jgi:Xaa-Pro aminopeptidase